jgi:hypothetical protein
LAAARRGEDRGATLWVWAKTSKFRRIEKFTAPRGYMWADRATVRLAAANRPKAF